MKTTVVFLHGYGMDKRIWQIHPLHTIGHPTVFLNLNGYGPSPLRSTQSLTELAQSLVEKIHEMTLTKIILVGHSMGGYVALEMLQLDVLPIKGVVLLNSHPFMDTIEKKEQRNKIITHLKKNSDITYKKFFAHTLFQSSFIENNLVLFQKVLDIILDQPKDTLIDSLIAMRDRRGYSNLISKNTTPIMIIHGKKDQLISVDQILIAESISPGLICHVLEEGSHMAMIENPELVVHYIRTFYDYCHEK